jgi:valyl-tRNA synthetase
MPKTYDPSTHEDGVYAAWEASGYFNPDTLPGEREEVFSIVLPPPNVTGTLHMGHAVMLALEDIMVRFERLRGKKALWIPGTDHAAIATQTKVEKLLMKEGIADPRRELGREKFLERVNRFAAESHDIIVNQARKMGASLDWSREAYTLDAARGRAVNTAFKQMYNDGIVYRGYRVINWCPRCKSTLADDEVNYKEEKSKFYYLKYGPIVIGTARPETKFLDKVIVVNPDDARYADIVGKEFDVEWIEGTVRAKVIADPEADMSFGTGAMTITPAHSHEDFRLAQSHGLEVVQIIGEDGCFTDVAGSFAGKNARASRDVIVEVLAKKGLVERIDDQYVHNLSVCYRCDTPVEPLPKLQWFIGVNKEFERDGKKTTLKTLMQEAVRSGSVQILPERFDKTYFHWIDNLRDWNISRQIWFGHRIPAWFRDEEIVVSETSPGEGWIQDEDTFDTWFSSGLWTFSTLGWPSFAGVSEDKPEIPANMRQYHPTSVLETGYDILFFWVARMILMSTYLLGEVPFKTVYLHGLVRDEQGRKMSKSLDNIIDPLDMIAKYGADATRLSLVIGSTPGNDSKLSEEKIAGYRNFTNKLWNISRFVLGAIGSQGRRVAGSQRPQGVTLADRWILSRLEMTVVSVTKKLGAHEFSAAGEELRDFTWNDFADWYLEIAKIQAGESTCAILSFVLERLLVLWHPFMPFVTEQIWKEVGYNEMLMVSTWPQAEVELHDEAAERGFTVLQEAIVTIRNARSLQKIEPAKKVDVMVGDASLLEYTELIQRLARVEHLMLSDKPGIQLVLGAMDVEAEQKRLIKESEQLAAYITSTDAKLANHEFTSKAPEKVVAQMKEKREEAATKLATVQSQLSSLLTSQTS